MPFHVIFFFKSSEIVTAVVYEQLLLAGSKTVQNLNHFFLGMIKQKSK